MKISELTSDDAILAEIGRRLQQRRLESQLTQAELAEQAGVSMRTRPRSISVREKALWSSIESFSAGIRTTPRPETA